MKRTPLKRISDKKLAALGGKTPRSSLKASAGLRTRTPMARGTKPLRRTRLKPVGKKGSRYPKRRNRPFTDWVRENLECLLSGHPDAACWHPEELRVKGWKSDPAHVCGKTRGAGAYDAGEVAPLCRKHHDEQEGRTAVFEKHYRVDLKLAAQQTWTRYERVVLGVTL